MKQKSTKVSGKKLSKLAARLVKFDPTSALANGDVVAFFNGSELKMLVNVADLVALAASVLSQSEPVEKKAKKGRGAK